MNNERDIQERVYNGIGSKQRIKNEKVNNLEIASKSNSKLKQNVFPLKINNNTKSVSNRNYLNNLKQLNNVELKNKSVTPIGRAVQRNLAVSFGRNISKYKII